MTRVMVRYTVRPEEVARNEELVRAVYAELASAAPDGFRYATFRAGDSGTFVHVAETDGERAPLTSLPAFAAFQAELRERCVEPPVFTELRQVGAYGF